MEVWLPVLGLHSGSWRQSECSWPNCAGKSKAQPAGESAHVGDDGRRRLPQGPSAEGTEESLPTSLVPPRFSAQ